MESWVYPNDSSGLYGTFFNIIVSSGYNLHLQLHSNQFRALDFKNPNSNFILVGGASTNNAWTHVVFTRHSSNMRLFANGVLVGYQAGVTHNYGTIQTCSVGPTSSAYLTNVRLTVGSVPTNYQTASTTLSTQIYAPPTAPLTAIANTSLLLNFTDAAITDATAKNVLETVDNAQISIAQSKWGGGSMYFDGSGDYLNTPPSPANILGSGDFTVEFWIYPDNTSVTYRALVSSENYAITANGWGIYQYGTNIQVWITGQSPLLTATDALTNSTWKHVALSRSSGTLRFFINGTSSSSVNNSTEWTGQRIFIGANYDGYSNLFRFPGYISDLRITKGVVRYTANFTPPSGSFRLR
jgi:hypothetical protein